MRRIFALSAALLLLTGCEEDIAGPSSVECNVALTSFQMLSGDTVTTSGGIRYIEIQQGTGEIAAVGGTVDVNYALYEEDGSFVENSCDASVPVIRFLIGGGGILEGFQIGVIGMSEGGVRRVILPVEFGYPAGHPSGLGDQVLIFDIELVNQL